MTDIGEGACSLQCGGNVRRRARASPSDQPGVGESEGGQGNGGEKSPAAAGPTPLST